LPAFPPASHTSPSDPQLRRFIAALPFRNSFPARPAQGKQWIQNTPAYPSQPKEQHSIDNKPARYDIVEPCREQQEQRGHWQAGGCFFCFGYLGFFLVIIWEHNNAEERKEKEKLSVFDFNYDRNIYHHIFCVYRFKRMKSMLWSGVIASIVSNTDIVTVKDGAFYIEPIIDPLLLIRSDSMLFNHEKLSGQKAA